MSRLIGKTIDADEDSRLLFEGVLYAINMGYHEPEDSHKPAGTLFNWAESEYDHHFSFKQIGKRYGFNRLKEYIPLKDYLGSKGIPAGDLDEILKWVVEGENERFEYDEALRKKRAGEAKGEVNAEDFTESQKELAKRMSEIKDFDLLKG